MAGSTTSLVSCLPFPTRWFEAAANSPLLRHYHLLLPPNGATSSSCLLVRYNGLATILLLCRLLRSRSYPEQQAPTFYQIIYLFFGLITVVVGVLCWFFVLTLLQLQISDTKDRLKAVERLKANQQGIVSQKFKIEHTWKPSRSQSYTFS